MYFLAFLRRPEYIYFFLHELFRTTLLFVLSFYQLLLYFRCNLSISRFCRYVIKRFDIVYILMGNGLCWFEYFAHCILYFISKAITLDFYYPAFTPVQKCGCNLCCSKCKRLTLPAPEYYSILGRNHPEDKCACVFHVIGRGGYGGRLLEIAFQSHGLVSEVCVRVGSATVPYTLLQAVLKFQFRGLGIWIGPHWLLLIVTKFTMCVK
jgi:hypothetical protein